MIEQRKEKRGVVTKDELKAKTEDEDMEEDDLLETLLGE